MNTSPPKTTKGYRNKPGFFNAQNYIAHLVTDRHFSTHPDLDQKYGTAGRERCYEDVVFHLKYLATAIHYERHEIFTSYLTWAQRMLEARKIPKKDLIDNLTVIRECALPLLEEREHKLVNQYLQKGVKLLQNPGTLPGSCLVDHTPLFNEAHRYLTLILGGSRTAASSFIQELVKDGTSIQNLYEYVFKPCQYEIGRLWQNNEISVGREHYGTAATQLIISQLYPHIFKAGKKKAKLVACSVGGDLHEMGIRMISDLFEMEGWDTYYLGANMPAAHVVTTLKGQHADVMAISVTMPFHLPLAEELIKKIRTESTLSNIRVIVGGYAFNAVPDLWGRIGADAMATHTEEVKSLSHSLTPNLIKQNES